MKHHPEFMNALAMIAGDSKYIRGTRGNPGTISRVHKRTGIPEVKIRRWICYGIPADAAVQVWHMTNGKADLAKLTLEAGIIDKRKAKRAWVAA